MTIPSRLPECCIKILARPGWFDPLLLRSVKIKLANPLVRAIQGMAGTPVAATTIGNVIYYSAPEHFDPHSPGGLGLLAHELRHVEQYQERGGLVLFGVAYVREYLRLGYGTDISFEAEAYQLGNVVYEHLVKEFDHNAGQPPCLAVTGGDQPHRHQPDDHWPNIHYERLEPSPALPRRVR